MATYHENKLKLLYLMRYFIENTDEEHPTNSKEIIEYLNSLGISAERKSVYNDIETLRTAGMDIISKGKRGGCYLASGEFQLAELKLLVDAVQVAKVITPKKSNELIEKLSKQTSKYHANEFKRDVILMNRAKSANETIYYNIDRIHSAIVERKEISFRYMEWNLEKKLVEKPREYKISPWLLVWDDENYYLVGYDDVRKETRHYRVDKMKRVTVTKNDCKNEEEYLKLDKSAYGKATFGMFGGNRAQLKICFANELIGPVIDRFGTDIKTTPYDEHSFCVQLEIDVSNRFFGWLAGFGNDAKILEPYMAAEEFRRFILSIVENYR